MVAIRDASRVSELKELIKVCPMTSYRILLTHSQQSDLMCARSGVHNLRDVHLLAFVVHAANSKRFMAHGACRRAVAFCAHSAEMCHLPMCFSANVCCVACAAGCVPPA